MMESGSKDELSPVLMIDRVKQSNPFASYQFEIPRSDFTFRTKLIDPGVPWLGCSHVYGFVDVLERKLKSREFFFFLQETQILGSNFLPSKLVPVASSIQRKTG